MENMDAVRTTASSNESARLISRETHVLLLLRRLFHDRENNAPNHMAISDGTKMTQKVAFTVMVPVAKAFPGVLPVRTGDSGDQSITSYLVKFLIERFQAGICFLV
jgi:hypothetical protein